MRFTKKNNRGLTLIELILVTAILSVVSLAIYSTFNNGLRIWQRINKQLPEEDLNIFFDRFGYDLRNLLQFNGISFSGTEYRLAFATIVNSSRLQKRTVGEIIYFYDSQAEILKREERDFPQVFSGDEGPIAQSLTGVQSLRFQYYIYDTNKKEYLWQDQGPEEGIPLAVRMELEFKDGTQTHKFTKTVNIPVGG